MTDCLRYLWILSIVLLMGCRDNSYRGDWDEYDDSPDNKNLYPVWISVGPYHGLPTKSDDVEWNGKDIFIYAFKVDSSQVNSYKVTNLENKTICLIDGSKDGDPLGGKRGKRNDDDVLLYWAEGTEQRVIYPRGNEPYQFFGYIYDDAQTGNIIREDDYVEIPITIDGGQDVMVAYSDPQVTYEKLGDEFDGETKNDILSYSYSEYTAKHNIYPQLLFKHLLTRFRFKVTAGQMEEERTIHISSIRIISPSEASLVVAHKDVSRLGITFDEQSMKWMELEDMGKPLDPNLYFINTHQPGSMDVGDGLMIAPQKELVAEVSVYEDESGRVYTNTIPLRSNEGSFPAGTEYLVTFTIFGIMDVRVDTELIGWIDGGSYEYDSEIKPN